jgi:hypothetical protein
MSQNTKNTKQFTPLNGPNDWDSWNHQFRIKARSELLWDHIEKGEQLLERPGMPTLATYQRQPASSSRSQTVEAEGSQSAQPTPLPSRVSELSAQSRTAWQQDMAQFAYLDKQFRDQNSRIQKLRDWVTETVAPHYVEVACDPDENPRQWYANLKRTVGVSDSRSQISAREEYKEAIKPLTKPKDWQNWLSNWEKAMNLGRKKNVAEALNTSAWAIDFLIAVQPIAEQWTIVRLFWFQLLKIGLCSP